MPLIQITDVFNEPLDLWLSPNHEGQRRYVRKEDLLPEQTGEHLGFSDNTDVDPRITALVALQQKQDEETRRSRRRQDRENDDAPAAANDAEGVRGEEDGGGAPVICSFIPEDDFKAAAGGPGTGSSASSTSTSTAVVPRLHPRQSGANDEGETDEAMVVRVPAPSPLGLIGTLKPIPSVLPHPDRKNPVQIAEEARLFSSEAGVPTVFVTRPSPNVMCRVCKDVYLDPVVANDGFTYCRKCTPNLGDLDVVDGYEFDKSDLARNHEVWEKILCAQILCKHGLQFKDNASGANQWVYNPEGCGEAVTFETRAAHERGCGYARARCGLPRGKRDNDSCPLMIYLYEREEHQSQCPFRLVECPVAGCRKRVQFNRRAQHASLCEFKMIECPNGCQWRGRRSELVAHKGTCELETVTCGRDDTEDPSCFCSFVAERRFMLVHEAECEYRPLLCPHCGKGCSARHAPKHESTCAERRLQCERCEARVLVRRMPDHESSYREEHHCGRGSFQCEFAKYGCAERGSKLELDAHCEEDAARHLRLVMLAVEGVAASFKTWYDEVDSVRGAMIDHVKIGARDIEAAAAETRRVEEAGKAEVERLRVGLADLRAYYEEEVDRLHGQVTRVRKDSEARVKDLSAENDALHRALSAKMTRAEGAAWMEEMRAAREACQREMETTRDAVDRHRQRWERDVTKVNEELKLTDDECRERIEGVVQRLEGHTSNDLHRTEKIWEEVQEANKEFVSELDALGGRQRDLEQRWQEMNELLRGEPRREAEEAWAARGEENDAASPARARSNGGQKSLSQYRAHGAAQLLFGKGTKVAAAAAGGKKRGSVAGSVKALSVAGSARGSGAGSADGSVIGRPGSARQSMGGAGFSAPALRMVRGTTLSVSSCPSRTHLTHHGLKASGGFNT